MSSPKISAARQPASSQASISADSDRSRWSAETARAPGERPPGGRRESGPRGRRGAGRPGPGPLPPGAAAPRAAAAMSTSVASSSASGPEMAADERVQQGAPGQAHVEGSELGGRPQQDGGGFRGLAQGLIDLPLRPLGQARRGAGRQDGRVICPAGPGPVPGTGGALGAGGGEEPAGPGSGSGLSTAARVGTRRSPPSRPGSWPGPRRAQGPPRRPRRARRPLPRGATPAGRDPGPDRWPRPGPCGSGCARSGWRCGRSPNGPGGAGTGPRSRGPPGPRPGPGPPNRG